MKIVIRETGEIKGLSIVNPQSGIDYIKDFVGNTGALDDGQFSRDDERDAYICDQGTFVWWATVVADNQALEDRINDLVQEHGQQAVYQAVQTAGAVDLEDHASVVDQVLDDAFGRR